MKVMDSSSNENGSIELACRVSKLENAIIKLKDDTSSSWQRWIEVLSKLILPLLLFWLAFTIKDSVQHALEYRRLEVESAEAIEKLLQTLHKEEVEIGKAMAAALTLSRRMVRQRSCLWWEHWNTVPPNTETAAKHGIFVLGLSHPDAVSRSLDTVLSKRKGQFRWQTHQAAIEILGKVEHPKARSVLLTYQVLLEKPSTEGLIGWKHAVRGAKNENQIPPAERVV